MATLAALLAEIGNCQICAPVLPHPPRPVVQAGATARVVIIGQAPGRRVHESGVPWDDPSGRRLRDWLGVSSEVFYDADRFALVPMGFCYPGTGRSGDLPPRAECAPTWHPPLLDLMPGARLRILIGRYAVDRYLPDAAGNLADTVAAAAASSDGPVVLPHPSPRNNRWLKQHPWFAEETVPWLRNRVAAALRAG